MAEAPCIRLVRVSKRFGGVTALNGVSFEIRAGEVHAVVGENGAGKSTLMKLLAGVHEPDYGEIQLAGRRVRLKNPREARRKGISIVFQELNLFPHRTVAANVFANREVTRRWGWIDRRAMREATQRALGELDVRLSPDALVGPLALGEKQLVEIARTLEQESRIIILDEPNSALNEVESHRLFDIVRRLRDRGITIVYVSHRLEEVFAVADRITVLRDGRYQGTHATAEATMPQIITAMIGRQLDNPLPPRPAHAAPGTVALEVRELRQAARLGPISFTARAGEILGFAGLEGAGVEELFQVLFGLSPMTSGEILVRGERQRPTSPLAAMRRGWALIPASRREQGLMMDWSIARNATLLVLGKLLNRLGLIDQSAVRRATDHYVRRFGILSDGRDQKVVNLSGGNQQKVLLAKWLAPAPAILILNDPTRGVDVGAKWEIYELCQQLAAEGMTILMTSTEAEEILGLADRVLVFSKGKVLHEFQRGEMDKARLMHAMAGAAPAAQ
ncbi:MAG: sugar ABC transporter ATP-binding protein [Verrucomicrobia bacterium]|nr:sugar ABC transporter ATP-binding protein [Verrucomicrobiota bacterium]